jgi:hypothetical protein
VGKEAFETRRPVVRRSHKPVKLGIRDLPFRDGDPLPFRAPSVFRGVSQLNTHPALNEPLLMQAWKRLVHEDAVLVLAALAHAESRNNLVFAGRNHGHAIRD